MKLDITKRKILAQLQENTGRALCDSGGAYGRNWERNQGKTWEDFTKNPVTLGASVYDGNLELSGSVSLAAFLENNLTYSPELQRAFNKWCKQHPDEYDMAWMDGFAQEHNKSANVVNSYNGDCDLTQTIQFVEFEWGEYSDRYVLLQVHGGCDMRGGYSSPVAYALRDYVESLWDWGVRDYWAGETSWDEEGDNVEDRKLPNLFTGYKVAEFEWEGTLAKDLENLKQTDHDNEETRQLMVAEDAHQLAEALAALQEEVDIVVHNHVAYLHGEPIQASCGGLEG